MSELRVGRCGAGSGDLRATVERKAAGLSPEQLAARSVPPSDLSVLGLVRHLAQMEHYWFVLTLSRADEPQLYVPDGDWDAQFRDAVADEAVVAEAFETWRGVRGRADAVMDGLEPAEAWSSSGIPTTGSVRSGTP